MGPLRAKGQPGRRRPLGLHLRPGPLPRPPVTEADDSLAQRGRPFHRGGDTRGRSPRLNGAPLSDCQSSGRHRDTAPSSCGRHYARTPGWIHLPRLGRRGAT